MIYTGIVEDNTDPRHFNRVKVRVYGMHTDQDNGQMQIPTDDLPWSTPLVSCPIPPLGSTVNVIMDGEISYYVCPFPLVKMDDADYQNGVVMLHQDNLGQSVQNGKVINTKSGQHITMMYTDSNGFVIEYETEAGVNKINISPSNTIDITNANGDGMSIDMSNGKLSLKADTIELDCKKLTIGDKGNKKLLTEDFLQLYNAHTHTCPSGTTTQPIVQADCVSTKNIDITE